MDESEKVTLGDARRRLGLSINQASRALGISNGELERYEMDSGSMPCSIAVKACRLLRIQSFDLFHIGFVGETNRVKDV